MNRINAVSWEKERTSASRNSWLEKNLTGDKLVDLDLVIIQLGDGYNTTASAFETDSKALVNYIRKYAPSAEIVWIGLWNSNPAVYEALPGICEQLGVEFINISDLNNQENQSSIRGIVTDQKELSDYEEVFYPNDKGMQLISNRIIEKLKFEF